MSALSLILSDAFITNAYLHSLLTELVSYADVRRRNAVTPRSSTASAPQAHPPRWRGRRHTAHAATTTAGNTITGGHGDMTSHTASRRTASAVCTRTCERPLQALAGVEFPELET